MCFFFICLVAYFKLLHHVFIFSRLYSSNDGAIRDAGGSFSKKEAADEERYFRKLVKSF